MHYTLFKKLVTHVFNIYITHVLKCIQAQNPVLPGQRIRWERGNTVIRWERGNTVIRWGRGNSVRFCVCL